MLKTVGHSPLLSPVLEGLAKFAHLINVDFFSDLMAALQTLLDNNVCYVLLMLTRHLQQSPYIMINSPSGCIQR